jgi:hypothetical protein
MPLVVRDKALLELRNLKRDPLGSAVTTYGRRFGILKPRPRPS